jgi:hypothetical protein
MTPIVKVIYWVSITFLLLAASSIAHSQNPQYQRPIFSDHPQRATAHELPSGGGTYAASGEGRAGIPTPVEESLGNAARRLKAGRTGQPKAKKVYVNQ